MKKEPRPASKAGAVAKPTRTSRRPRVRRLTKWALWTLAVGAALIGLAWLGGARPGFDARLHDWWVLPSTLVGILFALAGGLCALLCVPLEVYDRLPAGVQARIRALRLDTSVLVGRLFGMPLSAHWSFALVMVPLLMFGGRFARPLVFLIAVILVHELGHAAVVRLAHGRVLAIELSPIGGVCRYQGVPGPIAQAAISWGGVLGQAALGLCVALVMQFVARDVAIVLGRLARFNFEIAAFNLLPFRPLDGATAWTLPILLWRRWRRPRIAARPRSPRSPSARSRQAFQQVIDEALEDARKSVRNPGTDDDD